MTTSLESGKRTEWAWANIGPLSNHTASLTLLVLAKRADEIGADAVDMPGQFLADYGVSRSSFIRSINAMERIGLVEREKRWDLDGRQMPTRYRLRLDRLLAVRPIAEGVVMATSGRP